MVRVYFYVIFVAIVSGRLEGSLSTQIRNDVWWGAGNRNTENTSISTFSVKVPETTLEDLNIQLDRFLSRDATPSLEGTQFQLGFNSAYLRKVVNYWRHQYNERWAERLKYFNQYPQYTTTLNGLRIHFIQVTPKSVRGRHIVPMLILHGWPGSVLEFYKLIPLLTDPQNKSTEIVFEIIAPSLPGFGFSEGARKPGLGPIQMAVIMNNLMTRLGFKKYYVQGGDWGSVIVKFLGQLYPKRVKGIHSNLCLSDTSITATSILLGSLNPSLVVRRKFQHLMYPLDQHFQRLIAQTGYFHVQATKPDTIGFALADSPAGLAAYILEKFSLATNWNGQQLFDGGLTERFTIDSLLDNVMLYWITNSITTSMRIYSEYRTPTELSYGLYEMPVFVPTACARFHHDVLWESQAILALKYRHIVQISDYPEGGHFAAMEMPSELAEDILSAVGIMEGLQKERKIKTR